MLLDGVTATECDRVLDTAVDRVGCHMCGVEYAHPVGQHDENMPEGETGAPLIVDRMIECEAHRLGIPWRHAAVLRPQGSQPGGSSPFAPVRMRASRQGPRSSRAASTAPERLIELGEGSPATPAAGAGAVGERLATSATSSGRSLKPASMCGPACARPGACGTLQTSGRPCNWPRWLHGPTVRRAPAAFSSRVDGHALRHPNRCITGRQVAIASQLDGKKCKRVDGNSESGRHTNGHKSSARLLTHASHAGCAHCDCIDSRICAGTATL